MPGNPFNIVTIPYTMSDTVPSFHFHKGISVRNTVPTCSEQKLLLAWKLCCIMSWRMCRAISQWCK